MLNDIPLVAERTATHRGKTFENGLASQVAKARLPEGM
jgi:hypothetical protein